LTNQQWSGMEYWGGGAWGCTKLLKIKYIILYGLRLKFVNSKKMKKWIITDLDTGITLPKYQKDENEFWGDLKVVQNIILVVKNCKN